MNNNKKNIIDNDFIDISDGSETPVEIENLSFEAYGETNLSGEGKGTISEENNEGNISSKNLENNLSDPLDKSNSGAPNSGNGESGSEGNADPNESQEQSSNSDNDLANDNNQTNNSDNQNNDSTEEHNDRKDQTDDSNDKTSDNKDDSSDKKETKDEKNNKSKDEESKKSSDKKDDKEHPSDSKNDDLDKKNKEQDKKNPEQNNDKKTDSNNNSKNNKKDEHKSNAKDTSNQKPDSSINNSKKNDAPNTNQNVKKGRNPQKNHESNPKPKKANKNHTPRTNKANSGIKQAGNGLKDGAKKVGKKAGETVGKVAKKGAEKVGEAAAKLGEKLVAAIAEIGWPVLVIIAILAVIIIIIFLIANFSANATPGQGNDINDPFNEFSENDKRILEDINLLAKKPNAELALFAVAYPYFENIRDGSIDSLLTSNEELDEETQSVFDKWITEKKQEILDSFGCDDFCQELLGDEGINQIIKTYAKQYVKEDILGWCSGETIENESGEKECSSTESDSESSEMDDPYIQIFKKTKYLNAYRDLLATLNSNSAEGDYSSETAFFEALDDYFTKDAGYESLFAQTKEDEELKNLIKDDLISHADTFSVYIEKEGCGVIYNFENGGQITPSSEDIKSMMMGNVVIDLLAPGCGDTGLCSSYYNAPISLEKYIKGVVYEELGSSNNLEQIKAQMVAAKSYTISRHKPSVVDGIYVVKMRWSTADQDYCDYESGCKDVKENYGYNNYGDCLYSNGADKCKHHANRPPATEEKKALYDQAWEETKNIYVVDSNGTPKGSYYEGCAKGKCMDQAVLITMNDMDYQSMLTYFYSDYAIAVQEGEYVTAMVATMNNACATGGILDDNFIYYNQNDYDNIPYSNYGDIKSHGCGPTSMAMVLANLVNPYIDPTVTTKEACDGGYCTSTGTAAAYFHSAASKYGLESKAISTTDKSGINVALETLNNGGLIIVNVNANSPFTTGGHYIVLRKTDSSGNIYVADPNHPELFDTPYNLNSFYDGNWFASGGWIAFNKIISSN